MAFGDFELSLEQAVWFISNAMRIRISNLTVALLFPALVEYGTRIIHPLLEAIYTTLSIEERKEK